MTPTTDDPLSKLPDPSEREQLRQARNNQVLLRFGLFLGAAILIALSVGPGFFAPTLSTFLFVFGIGTAMAAGIARESLLAEHLTRWDQAAALFLISLLAKAFIDHEFLEQARQSAL